MSAFGALPIDVQTMQVDAIAASSNKCIEGVPGLGFVIAREAALAETKGNATTLVLDLHDQWQNFVEDRTVPLHTADPCHRIVPPGAEEFFAEGGQPGRGGRYANNGRVLVEGMQALGFKLLLSHNLQAPIIYTFHMPKQSASSCSRRSTTALKDARLRDLSGQAHGGRQLSHRLHRPDQCRRTCAAFLAAVAEVLAEHGRHRLEVSGLSSVATRADLVETRGRDPQ